MKGKFIVIEGTDCSGKETQTKLIEKKLTTSKWFGVTYAADRQGVVDKIQALVDAGEYPSKLF